MAASPFTRLLLIRHAVSTATGQLAGRLDVPANLPAAPALAQARAQLACLLPGPRNLFSSPALRCRQTAEALLPGAAITEAPRLWEQHFGTWEGMENTSLPDLGPMNRTALAAHCPPDGESFLDVCRRVEPALEEVAAGGPAIIVTHAGVIRTALGLALGDAASGLAFEIAPFSATMLTRSEEAWSIGFVNRALAP